MIGNKVTKASWSSHASMERILVVEDDPCLWPFWGHLLWHLKPWASIRWCSSAEEACLVLDENLNEGKAPDLVIADILLSGSMSGMDLWMQYKMRSDIEVPAFLIVSGQPERKIQSMLGEERKRVDVLLKPIQPAACLSVIERLLKRT